MSGFTHALWLWLPVLIYKAVSAFFRTIWKFNLWILQTISGTPLYYCKPEYRIPGIFLGTVGLISSMNFLFLLLIAGTASSSNIQQGDLPIESFLLMGFIGVGLLLLCRFLIRKGSL